MVKAFLKSRQGFLRTLSTGLHPCAYKLDYFKNTLLDYKKKMFETKQLTKSNLAVNFRPSSPLLFTAHSALKKNAVYQKVLRNFCLRCIFYGRYLLGGKNSFVDYAFKQEILNSAPPLLLPQTNWRLFGEEVQVRI